jgi:single-stranded-DNA-specific exonuclease
MQKKWLVKQTDDTIVQELQEVLRIHPALCTSLVIRGIQTFDEARQFFRTSEDHLLDPFLMKGMEKAVDRIYSAINNNEKILIYGDYDVDGTTSVAVVYSYLKGLQCDISFYIPHRFREGYGVSAQGIDYAIANQVGLIITLDCGIKSTTHIQRAASEGIDVIVCDHHMPDEELPPAYAILNPKQPDCLYPYKELCGCGIGYKLISAIAKKYQLNTSSVNKHIDLVATAIAADIVPITGENRTLCVLGLDKANREPSTAIQALKFINELKRELTITDLVFIIAPRVNAAGRMDDARKAVELFIEDDLSKAKEIAQVLHDDNNLRKDIDRSTTAEALEMAGLLPKDSSCRSTVVYQPHWHKGVVGIVASRLIEHHYRPTIVLTQSEGKVTGSARSIKGFNLFEGLNQCAEYLETWGGHYYAAGLTLKEENLADFTQRFNEVVTQIVPEDLFQPVVDIDAEILLADINPSFLAILKQFAPHGPENMRPVFISRNVYDYQGKSSIVKEKHLKLNVTQNGHDCIQAIGFNLADKMDLIKGKSFDMIYYIEENEWNGNINIQLKIIDIR